jgi:hypothetical protein
VALIGRWRHGWRGSETVLVGLAWGCALQHKLPGMMRQKFMEPAIFYCRLESPNSTHGGGNFSSNFNGVNPNKT